MNCTDADIWWTAMTTMLETLEVILQPWKLVEDEPRMKNLPCTWAFQIKHFPDDLIKKFKACCICGDCQTEGVDFLEIWSPVVQYSMIRTMMILSTKFCSAQADVMAAFVHAELGPDKQIFVHQPTDFQGGQNLVLSLKNFVYGLCQAHCYFFQHLKHHIDQHGLKQCSLDPCLFVGKKFIALWFVNDILLYT
ncbi:LOW QUALITY PROTEIN: hypothetical protein ACHAW6_005379 [Cyclotella cf. meneghiniana]